MTSYLMALDDRIQAAAPRLLPSPPFDASSKRSAPRTPNRPSSAKSSSAWDHPDYTLMRAAKPTLIMTATDDFFDITGAWHNFRETKRIYDRPRLPRTRQHHRNRRQTRLPAPPCEFAAARWMRRWLLGIDDDAVTEPDFPVAKDEDVWCTPQGEVMLLDGARSVYDLNMELEAKLAQDRKRFWKETDTAKVLDEVRRITGIRKLADLPKPKSNNNGKNPTRRLPHRQDHPPARDGHPHPRPALHPRHPQGRYLPLPPRRRQTYRRPARRPPSRNWSPKATPSSPPTSPESAKQRPPENTPTDPTCHPTGANQPSPISSALRSSPSAPKKSNSALASPPQSIMPVPPRPVHLISIGRTGPPCPARCRPRT